MQVGIPLFHFKYKSLIIKNLYYFMTGYISFLEKQNYN